MIRFLLWNIREDNFKYYIIYFFRPILNMFPPSVPWNTIAPHPWPKWIETSYWTWPGWFFYCLLYVTYVSEHAFLTYQDKQIPYCRVCNYTASLLCGLFHAFWGRQQRCMNKCTFCTDVASPRYVPSCESLDGILDWMTSHKLCTGVVSPHCVPSCVSLDWMHHWMT